MTATGLYVNPILRGIQVALDTKKRGQDLILAAEKARRAEIVFAVAIQTVRERVAAIRKLKGE